MRELNDSEYKDTMTSQMIDVTETANPVVDIWPSVKTLHTRKLLEDYVYENQLVEFVYRNATQTFDHILLPTKDKNIFIVIIVDIIKEEVKGYRILNLNKEYNLT